MQNSNIKCATRMLIDVVTRIKQQAATLGINADFR
jgi:hypothetical protein